MAPTPPQPAQARQEPAPPDPAPAASTPRVPRRPAGADNGWPWERPPTAAPGPFPLLRPSVRTSATGPRQRPRLTPAAQNHLSTRAEPLPTHQRVALGYSRSLPGRSSVTGRALPGESDFKISFTSSSGHQPTRPTAYLDAKLQFHLIRPRLLDLVQHGLSSLHRRVDCLPHPTENFLRPGWLETVRRLNLEFNDGRVIHPIRDNLRHDPAPFNTAGPHPAKSSR